MAYDFVEIRDRKKIEEAFLFYRVKYNSRVKKAFLSMFCGKAIGVFGIGKLRGGKDNQIEIISQWIDYDVADKGLIEELLTALCADKIVLYLSIQDLMFKRIAPQFIITGTSAYQGRTYKKYEWIRP